MAIGLPLAVREAVEPVCAAGLGSVLYALSFATSVEAVLAVKVRIWVVPAVAVAIRAGG